MQIKFLKLAKNDFDISIYYTIKDDIIYILAIANHYRDLEEYSKRF